MFQKKRSAANFALEYETERLILKILTPDYLREVLDFQWRNRKLFEKYEPSLPENYYTAEHQQAILRCEFQMALKMETIRYYVFLKEDPSHIIGTVCLHDIRRFSYSCSELGYRFDADYHHMGYATEAITKVLSIAFHELDLHRVFARVMPENTSSLKLLRSLHFLEEGIEHESIQIQGKWCDHLRFAMLNPGHTSVEAVPS